jgi:hypothetical protein
VRTSRPPRLYPRRFFRSGNRWISLPYFAAAIAIRAGRKHDQRMGTRARSSSPDLFSSAPIGEAPSRSSESPVPPSATPSRHVLPADLPNAVRQLNDYPRSSRSRNDGESSSLLFPARGRPSGHAVPLTQGKLNAVRAAFKAGVTPSRIARQFGISQSDVRKALASETRKR